MQELHQAKVFIPLLSTHFRASDWATQEIGVAVADPQMLFIPISLDGTNPFGFIAQLQGKRLPEKQAAEFFAVSLAARFPRETVAFLLEQLEKAGGWRHAESLMEPLVPLFSLLTDAEINQFVDISIGNKEIWAASLCRNRYIPEFIRKHGSRIDPQRLKVLEYQIQNEAWYP